MVNLCNTSKLFNFVILFIREFLNYDKNSSDEYSFYIASLDAKKENINT